MPALVNRFISSTIDRLQIGLPEAGHPIGYRHGMEHRFRTEARSPQALTALDRRHRETASVAPPPDVPATVPGLEIRTPGTAWDSNPSNKGRDQGRLTSLTIVIALCGRHPAVVPLERWTATQMRRDTSQNASSGAGAAKRHPQMLAEERTG